jgi:natural resistance-associated macrophage protein 2
MEGFLNFTLPVW